MTAVHTCNCGARVRLPETAAGKAFRCPRCKAEIDLVAARTVVAARAAAVTGVVCPICQTGVAEGEPTRRCGACEQVHHAECWDEVGGCSTYGCAEAPAADKGDAAVSRPLSAWGDDKDCPVCGEKIKSIAVRCRYCGTDFDTVDPLTQFDVRRRARRSEEVDGARKTAIVLFILTLFGCLAPLTLPLSFVLTMPKKELLRKAGPVYLVLAYSTVALAALYCLLLLGVLVYEMRTR